MKKNQSYITIQSVKQYLAGTQYHPRYFIRYIFMYLRAHPELWDDSGYKRLYDEALEFWINTSHETEGIFHDPAELKDREFLADLFIRYSYNNEDMLTKEQVDRYLEHRRSIWNASK